MAASGVGFEDHGALRALSELAEHLADLSDPLKDLGDTIVKTMTPVTPVLTGALVASLTAEVKADEVLVKAGEGLDYAAPQNAGVPSRNIPGTHFLDRGEEFADQHAAEEVDKSLQQLINHLGL